MSLNTKLKYPLVYLEWCDAFSYSEKWMGIEDALKKLEGDEFWVKECGFIIKEDKNQILFCSRINTQPENKDNWEIINVDGLFKIPKTWIKKRIDLSKFISS